MVAIVAAVVLTAAYLTYGRFLARRFELDPNAKTPAWTEGDGRDFIPTESKFLAGQHFSAIAAAGPIVGPILAGVAFGWGPALAWILVGSILIGGVHDMAALVASIRHRARTIAEVVREHMSRRSYVLFLTFIWLALVYIIVAFTDVTAQNFVGVRTLEGGHTVKGGGIATSSLLYLLLPLAMGFLLRYTKASLGLLTAIFLPLVAVAIWVGQAAPIELGMPDAQAQRLWGLVILGYCVLAAVAPIWALLQPRGHLGGYFLAFFLATGVFGLLFGGRTAEYPIYKGWTTAGGDTLAPLLFITIACGACSGFHALIASGTTSKQLQNETDARPIGYGTMLLEAMVAIIALSTVMMLTPSDPLLSGGAVQPNFVFASGIGGYLGQVGVPIVFAVAIMLMAFTTFVYDTLDVCTRLGRYIVQELTGRHDRVGMWAGTLVTAAVPGFFLLAPSTPGKPAWMVFWQLFGASNQLLAALTLLGVTVWLWNTGRRWALAVTGLPCVFMYGMSVWALTTLVLRNFRETGVTPVPVVGVVLLALAAMMAFEAIGAFTRPPRTSEALPA